MIDIKVIQNKCINLYNKGLNCKQIGDRLGLEYHIVSFLLKAADINVKQGKTTTHNIDREKIYQLYWVEKLTIKEIAVQFGVSESTISRYLKDADAIRKGV